MFQGSNLFLQGSNLLFQDGDTLPAGPGRELRRPGDQVCFHFPLDSKSPAAFPDAFAGPEFASTDFHLPILAEDVASYGWPGTSGVLVTGLGALGITVSSYV
jgi:hypothetical protein